MRPRSSASCAPVFPHRPARCDPVASRLPWAKWFYRDWMTDPNLSMCSPQTRGIWVDLVSSMMGQSDITGELSGTALQLARIARCTEGEMKSALAELSSTGTAGVVTCHANSVTDHSVFTVTSRRMSREHSERESARKRKRKQRIRERENEMSRQNHGPVTEEKSEHRSQIQKQKADKGISEPSAPHSARAENSAGVDAIFDGHDLGVEALRKHQGKPFRAHARSGKSPAVQKRRREVRDAAATYGMETCRLAARNLVLSPHHRGENDRNTEYLDIGYAMRKVECYADLCALSDEEFRARLPSLIAQQANGNGRRKNNGLEIQASSNPADYAHTESNADQWIEKWGKDFENYTPRAGRSEM